MTPDTQHGIHQTKVSATPRSNGCVIVRVMQSKSQREAMFEVLIYGAMAVLVVSGLAYANWAVIRAVETEAEEMDDVTELR